jgi:Tfp pilus assembly protein PilN
VEVNLNLATRPLENIRRFVLLAGIAGVAAAALFAVLSLEAYRTWKSNRDLREEMARLTGELREFRARRSELEQFFKQDESKRVLDRAGFLNGMIEQRAFPWTKIFMDLERRLPHGVRVISISPRREGGRVEVKFSIGATSDENKLKFLQVLDEWKEFSSVQVTSESRSATGDEGDKVVLELIAQYQAMTDAVTPGTAPPAPARTAGKAGSP